MKKAILLLVLLAFTTATSSPGSDNPISDLIAVKLKGLSGAANNIAFVDGRYVLVAPFAPSKEADEAAPLSKYDNHYLYLIDTQNPSADPVVKDLTCYFPTKLFYDSSTRTVFVRATDYLQAPNGSYQPIEVIAYVRLGEAAQFDTTVIKFAIEGEPYGGYSVWGKYLDTENWWATAAPSDFAVAAGDAGRRYLLYTNGAKIFSYDIAQGYLYRVGPFVSDYSPDGNTVAYLGLDSKTNTLIVTSNKAVSAKDGTTSYSSELYFYHLVERNGTVDLIKRVRSSGLVLDGRAVALTVGSNAVVSPDLEFALFVADDGSLCQVRFKEGSFDEGKAYRLALFPELAAGSDSSSRGPRLISYDPDSNSVNLVKRGYMLNIARPVYGKPGRPGGIARPVYSHLNELPAIVFAHLSKAKDAVSSSTSLTNFGKDEKGISAVVLDQNLKGLVATYSGQLLSLDAASGQMNYLGEIGSRVDLMSMAQAGLVAVRSFEADEASRRITDPGALVLARFLQK
jgi:hypothetical protein